MSLPATEDFNEGNGVTPANWTEVYNGIQCTSLDRGKADTPADYNIAYWASDVFSNDQYAQARYVGGNGYGGPAARVSGSGGTRSAYYALLGQVGASRLSKVVNGAITDLIAPGGISDPVNNDIAKVTVEGTSIKVYYQGVQQGTTQTDSSLASGSAGVIFFDTNTELDDWEGGNLVASQFARPDSDVADGAWTPSTGSDLYAVVDETSADDADYMRSAMSPVNDLAKLALSTLGTPGDGTVTLRVRHRRAP